MSQMPPVAQPAETTVDALHLAVTPGQPRGVLMVGNLSDRDITQLNLVFTGSSLIATPSRLFIPRVPAGAQALSELTLSFAAQTREAQLRFTAVYRIAGESRPQQISGALQIMLAAPPAQADRPAHAERSAGQQRSGAALDLPALRQLLITLFNESELRDICFDLNIDYESLEGQGKSSKARELIRYVQRSGRTAELITLCRRLRPHADW